jgi:colanic acid/amylovoran biosynthesis protein
MSLNTTINTQLNIIVTGYYFEKNLGDDLFEKIGREIFTEQNFKQKINKIEFMKIDKITSNEVYFKCDKLILFGGETLNDYFLNKIIEFKHKNPHTELYAIGVSTNQSYNLICNKVNIFDKIIFRNKADYNYFRPRLENHVSYAPDIVFTLKYKLPIINKKKPNNVGFFVATPIYNGLCQKEKDLFLKNMRAFINILMDNNFKVYMFPMCCNEKHSEDDLILIKKIIDVYTPSQLKKIKVIQSNKKILEEIPKMKYNFCWRFHSIVLSIIHNIPFVTFSKTPKVKNILLDYNLEKLNFDLNNYEAILPFLKENKKTIKKDLLHIYHNNNKEAIKNYLNFDIYKHKREVAPFYVSPSDYKKIIEHITHIYEKHSLTYDDDYNTNLILYTLTRTIDSQYFYGLREKLFMGINKLQADIKWLIDDMILNSNMYFYSTVDDILHKTSEIVEIQPETINMNYINQNDYEGLHRSGWSYVLHNMKDKQHKHGILCDFYVDRSFHWNNIIFGQLKVIPYVKPWIGFIHHTTETEYSDYNTVSLFENKLFLQSLKYCKGLIVLSDDLNTKVNDIMYKKKILNVPVFTLYHPTEFVNESQHFTLHKFKNNVHKKIIQVGAWMRDTKAIFNLSLLKEDESKVKLHKTVLIGKKMETYYDLSEFNNDIKTNNHTETETEKVEDKKRPSKLFNLFNKKNNKGKRTSSDELHHDTHITETHDIDTHITETYDTIDLTISENNNSNISRDKKDRRITITKRYTDWFFRKHYICICHYI